MYITTGVDTVVLHMPKCAGNSVRWAIHAMYPNYRWSCEHAHIDTIPERFKNFRRIGFCRNPITWYVSKYYHSVLRAQQKKDALTHVRILSDDFNLSFQETLPRMLDMRNFFDMNPRYIHRFKDRLRYLVMNHRIGRVMISYPDVSKIQPDDFKDTLYDHWYTTVGLETAVVYKMDDNRLFKNVNVEFPGTIVGHRNVQRGLDYKSKHTLDSINRIYTAEEKYFKKHNYEPEIV